MFETTRTSIMNDMHPGLESKLDACVFEEMFEKVNIGTASAPVYAIKAKFGLYTDEFISARGLNPWQNQGGAGLDETQLTQYLTENNYAKKSDIPPLTDYATHDWVEGKLNGIEAGANKYVHPKHTIRNIAAAAGLVLASVAVDVEGHVTDITSKQLAQADIPTLAISKISGLQTALDSKLNASVFNEFKTLFETYFTLENENGVKRIKANFGLYSDEFISARGLNPWQNAGAIGATELSELSDVVIGNNLANGQSLVYDGTKWVNRKAGLNTTELADYLTTNNYAKKSDIPSLSGYATQAWVTGKGYALNSDLTAHTSNATIHITSAERTLWNQTATDLSAILGSDTDNVINKYEEIVAFLDTYTEADTLANLLSNKADKTTKISAGTGLSGGGTLASDRTLSLAASGVTAGTYTKVTVDAYGRATAGASLVASDIPTLAISKISGLQTALDSKLNASVFNDFKTLFETYFELENVNGVKRIKAKFGLYSVDYVSARGVNADGSAGGSGFGLMRAWPSSDPTKNTTDALGANLGWELYQNKLGKTEAQNLYQPKGNYLTSITKAMVENVLTGNITSHTHSQYLTSHQSLSAYLKSADAASTYLTKTDAATLYQPKGNYLTAHQDIYKLTFQSGTFSAKSYTPNSAAQTVNIPTTTSHITEGTRLYFTDARAQSALAGTVADLNTAIGTKLPTATFDTFKSGYDTWKATIDAFKTKFESLFEKEPDGNGGWRIKAKFGLYTEQFLSARGLNGNAGGGASGNRLDSWNDYGTGKEGWLLSAKLGHDLKTRIDNLPTTSVNPYALTIQKNGATVKTYDGSAAVTANITIGWSDTASGRPSWIGASKPSYNFSEIGSKPTTLSGYGITDAKIANGVITLGDNTITPLTSHQSLANYYTKTEADGKYVTALGTNGDYLTWTKNGVAHNIVVQFATQSNWLKNNNAIAFGNSGVQWFNINGTAGCEVGVNDTPTTAWWHILRFNHGNTAGFYTDLAVPFNENSLYYKRIGAGALKTDHWVKILDDLNYTSVLDSVYVQKSGDTMTGALTVPTLTISNTNQAAHLAFSRGNYNYITAPASGSIAFVVNGKSCTSVTTELVISNGSITPGAQNNAVALGSSSYRWKNTYSVLGNFSGKVTAQSIQIGDCTITYENGGLRFSSGIYSDSFVSAKGLNSNAATGSGFGLMRSWPTSAPANTTTDALAANLGYELHTKVTALEGKNYLNDLGISVTGSGNAVTSVTQSTDKKTLTFTKGSTFLTSHQTLYTLTIQKNGTQVGTFKPNANATINLTDVASAATLSSHTGNSTIHITAAERTKWNTTSTNLDTILGSNADNVINKWDEVVAFLDTYTEADTLANLLSNKADKATTLAGYGITNAYTKTEINTKLTDGSVTKVGTATKGSASLPIYLNAGTPTACTASSLFSVLAASGNNISITVAGQNRTLTVPYATTANIANFLKYAVASNGNKNNYPFHRILTCDAITGQYNDKSGVYLIKQGYIGGRIGIFRVITRTNASTSDSQCEVYWLLRKGFTADSIQAGFNATPGGTYIDVFYKATGTYASVTVSRLAEGIRGGISEQFTMVSSQEVNNTTTTDNLTSTEVYTSLADAASKLGRTYTQTIESVEDAATVAHANTLTTARKIWGKAFDGSADITGDLTSVGNITGSAAMTIKATGILTLNGTSGIYLKYNNDDTKSLFLKDTAFKPFDTANNKLSLGTSGARWSNVYSVLGNFSGLITASAGIKIGDCEITYDSASGMLKFSKGIYSLGAVSARGANSSGGGGTAFNRLDSWDAYSDATKLYALSAQLGWDLYQKKADKTWVEGKGYLTSHQSLADYATKTMLTNGSVTKVGTATVGGTAKPIYLSGGTPTALSATVGSASVPVYLNAGTITQCTASSLFSSLTTSNNAISLTIAGQTRTLTVPFATKASYVASTSPIPATGHVLTYYDGSPTVGTDSGNAFKGSSATHTLWSFPEGGTPVNSENKANVQVLRFSWGTTYFHEIFTSPNYEDVWHRAVINGTAKDWQRFITTGNYTDYIKKIGTSTVGSATKPIYLNAGTPTASSSTVGGTAKPMWLNAGTMTAMSATVGASNQPVYLNAGTITAVTGVALGYLSEGGPNRSGSLGPADYINGVSATNKLEALPAQYIEVEMWNGSAWVDAGLTDAQKISLVSYAGRTTSATQTNATSGNKIRVTITAASGVLYFSCNKICINFSYNGANNSKVLVERSHNGSDTIYETVGTYGISGWSGWNSIYLGAFSFGGTETQTSNWRKLRLTFTADAATNDAHKGNSIAVHNILAFGRMTWSTPNTLNKWGVPYTYSVVDFSTSFIGNVLPSTNNSFNLGSSSYKWANVYATTFNGNLSGNAATATKLQTARTIWGQNFDGSGNVTGNMTGVGSITATGDFQTTKAVAAIKANNGSSVIGLYNSANRGVYDFTTSQWVIATDGTNTWLSQGNVGIGKTSPAYKLDVNGTTKTTKLIIGSITLEDVNGNLHINKGVYSDSFVSARGLNGEGGGSGTAYNRLDEWSDYTTAKADYVLSAKLGYDLYANAVTSSALNNALANFMPNSAFTGANILSKLLTVDGSGSGLDADMLDGVHNGSLTAKLLTHKAFDNASELDFSAVAWSAKGACSDISTFGYKSVLTIGGNFSRGWQIFSGRGDNHIYYRNAKNDASGWNDEIKTVAFTSDNVASANRLSGTTARTAWGQTFFTTGGVPQSISGNLTSVGNITGSGAMTVKANGRLTLNATSTALDLKFNNEEAKSVVLNGSAFKPFDAATNNLTLGSASAVWSNVYARNYTSDTTAYVSSAEEKSVIFRVGTTEYMRIWGNTNAGYVGINNPEPAYRLHISGTTCVDGDFRAGADGDVLFAQMSTGRVGVNNLTPAYTLDVDGTARATTQVITPKVHGTVILTLNGVSGIYLRYNNSDSQSLVLNSADFKPFTAADGAINLGTDTARWKKITACNMRLSSSASGAGGDVFAELWRGTAASWKLLNTGGTMKFQCNYTDKAGNYYDCMTIAHNTGNIYIKGNVGIKNNNPAYALDVTGDIQSTGTVRCSVLRSSTGLELFGNKPYIDFHYDNTTNDYDVRLINQTSGELKCVGTFYATAGVWSDGYVSARGQNTSSDVRLKRNLNAFEIALNQIANAPSVGFDWLDGSHDVGSIAQYWEKVNPLLTPKGPDGYLTLQYGKTALLASISIAKRVKSHEERIAELERE